VPQGPGAYTKPLSEEKSSDDAGFAATAAAGRALSPSPPFRRGNQDRFGRVIEPRVASGTGADATAGGGASPGPGSYDPLIPADVRSDSPTRGMAAAVVAQASIKSAVKSKGHGVLSPASPLAASQAHGYPLRSSAVGPPLGPDGKPVAKDVKRKKRAAGMAGPGRGLLATRGGPGVALNSPAVLLHPPGASVGTFGRAGAQWHDPGPAAVAAAALANEPAPLRKESDTVPPGPSFYEAATAFHGAHDRKTFHLNTAHRWM